MTMIIDSNMGKVATKPTGPYDASREYKRFEMTLHDYDSWVSKKDGNKGHTPADGSEWWYRATDGGKYARQVADAAVADAGQATDGAENVNAELNNTTVTITDRNGVSRSVDIGFEIYRTYASVDEMKADAANVADGKFVTIATDDPTSEENARLYQRTRNAADDPLAFKLISDLDQASSAAWADWLENKKPEIEQATDDADAAAALANQKAALADAAAAGADSSRQAADAAEQIRQANELSRVSAETQRQSDWTNFFSDTLATGCRKLWNDFWSLVNSSWTGFWGTSESDPNGVRKQWSDLHSQAVGDHQTAVQDSALAAEDHTTAAADHATAHGDHSTAAEDHTIATGDHTIATQDHTVAGQDHTTADTDHTTATGDHATAQGDHTVAEGDHDTATADHTTAEGDHTVAEGDHDTATGDHATADADHTLATADHLTAAGDHSTATEDHAASVEATEDAREQVTILEEWNSHPPFIGDGTTGDANYWYIWDSATEAYVRSAYAKGDDLHWDEMSQEEKEELTRMVLAELTFASVQTCEDIINEIA